MAIYDKKIKGGNGVNYTKEVDNSSDYSGLTNDTYFKNLSDGLIYYKNTSGDVITPFDGLNLGNSDLTLTNNRTVNLTGSSLTYSDSVGNTSVESSLSLGTGDTLTFSSPLGGAVYSKDDENISYTGGGVGGTFIFNVGRGTAQMDVTPSTGSVGGFTLGDDKIGTKGYVTYQTKGVVDDSRLSENNLYYFYVDSGELKGRYKDNLGVVTDLTIGANIDYKFVVRSNGTNTYYDDFYVAFNNSISGDIIDVYTDQTVDCGLGTGAWSWNKDITVNLNGHHITITNLGYIRVESNVNIKMTNGTFETENNSTNFSAFNFFGTTGTSTFEGDGAVNVFCYVGGSNRGSFYQRSTGIVKISGVIMKGNYRLCVIGGSGWGRMYLDKCILYTDEATNNDAVYGDNIEVSNSIIYGKAFAVSGSYGIPSRETVRTFINCNIVSDGESAIGSRSAIFSNCTITTKDDEVRIGIGGEQEYYNCKIERTGTVGTAFNITNTSNVRMYNTEIISTGGGVVTNLPLEFYQCYIKANNGDGIRHTSTINDLNLIVENSYIEATGGNCMFFDRISEGLTSTVTNSTLICNTTSTYCLNARTGSYYKFSGNSFKNTANSADVYSRAGLITENTQTTTTDTFGNIILD